MYKAKIEKILESVIKDLGFIKPTDPLLSIPEKSQFGDYSSNIALQISKQKHKKAYQNPVEIANAIIENLGHPDFLERVEVAGAGFLNFFLKDEALSQLIVNRESSIETDEANDERQTMNEKRIIVEYCDPNTHKLLHIGHLLQLTLGEAMSRLYEYEGHEVIRTNYGSDIGLTVAKCLWGVEKEKSKYERVKRKGSLRDKAEFLGEAYAYAHAEYEKSLEIKEEIDQITNKLYQRDAALIPLWEETKEWSLAYFDLIYSIFGTLFDRRINESEVDQTGKRIVMETIGKVFVKDDGAIIFPGEKYGLHNRVFINSKGNPTYEGKDIGLQEKYQGLFQYDQVNIFSHKEQDDYFKVIIKANEMVFPNLKGKIRHVSYGEVKLSSGKMSSRAGNVLAAEDIFNIVKEKIKSISPQLDENSQGKLAVAAIKFAFLKYSVSSDIVYDLEESVSIHGDTGPYVIYVYARIMSILRKATGLRSDEGTKSRSAEGSNSAAPPLIEPEEREILRYLEYFEFTVKKAADNFQPNEITKYLLNLCKAFNLFYEKMPILSSKQEEFRLMLCKTTAENIKLGLYLLGIETVNKM